MKYYIFLKILFFLFIGMFFQSFIKRFPNIDIIKFNVTSDYFVSLKGVYTKNCFGREDGQKWELNSTTKEFIHILNTDSECEMELRRVMLKDFKSGHRFALKRNINFVLRGKQIQTYPLRVIWKKTSVKKIDKNKNFSRNSKRIIDNPAIIDNYLTIYFNGEKLSLILHTIKNH